jgi:predicted RNA methylase
MLTSVRLALDCANTIRSIEGRNMSPYGQIVKEIQIRAHDFFVEFVHENRKSNVDAHTIARSLISFDTGKHVWFLEPPFGICNYVDQVDR